MRNNSNTFIKRLMVLFAGVFAMFSISSCTKSFCTTQDQANQIAGYYGDIFETSVNLPDTEENYALKNDHRTTLFTALSETNGYTLPDKDFLNFIETKANDQVELTYTLWKDGTLASENETTARSIAKNVALYAGVNSESGYYVADLWTNFDTWYDLALKDESLGILKCPSSGFVTTLKSTVSKAISSNTACITPESKTFNQTGSSIYIESKSWGEAFSQYGFLEGLLVYPLACLIHVISEGLGANGWAQLFAIFIVTLIVRSVTVVSTIYQGKSQAKQAKIQPQLNELMKKYPNSQTDKDQRQALSMEQSKLMKKAGVHPLMPMLFLILQYPIFICIWSALQGSASLAGGSWLGLSLTTTVSTCVTSYSTTPGAIVGIFVFIFMAISNVLSSMTSMLFTSWRTANFNPTPKQVDAQGNEIDPAKTTKTMMYVMMIFVLIMGWSLPVAMGIYWIIGSIIAILQALLTELIQTKERHKLLENTGDGSSLATIRRSVKHVNNKPENKSSNNNKPLWR